MQALYIPKRRKYINDFIAGAFVGGALGALVLYLLMRISHHTFTDLVARLQSIIGLMKVVDEHLDSLIKAVENIQALLALLTEASQGYVSLKVSLGTLGLQTDAGSAFQELVQDRDKIQNEHELFLTFVPSWLNHKGPPTVRVTLPTARFVEGMAALRTILNAYRLVPTEIRRWESDKG